MSAPHPGPLDGEFQQVYELAGVEVPTLRRHDVESLSGVQHERAVRWWRAMGFPEIGPGEAAFNPRDVEMVRRLESLIAAGALTDDDALRLARLMGASFSRLVEAQLAVFPGTLAGLTAEGATTETGSRPREAVVELGPALVDYVEGTMTYVWRRHLLAALARRLSIGETEGVQAVGFADLSGFSQVSKRASEDEISEIIDEFETAAFEVVADHGGRVVKMIGDEVMFVADDLDAAVGVAVDLIMLLQPVEVVPPVHCGVAYGPTVLIGGDVFGPTVNLASRLTGLARRDSVAVPRADAAHLLDRDDLDVRSPRRSYDLKGVGRTRILVIRPPREPKGDRTAATDAPVIPADDEP